MAILDHTKAYQKYFEEITKIPHGSYNEKALSDYVVAFAKEQGLEVKQDEFYNVVIYKGASAGYEDHPTVALQAHLDMVDEKNSDCDHDFEKDALELLVDGEFLTANGTTLGADDGAGIAYIMAVLSDKNLKHPALEAIFTTQEEVTMEGAFNLDAEWISARRLINLDGEEEGVSSTTSAGGIDVVFQRDLTCLNAENNGYHLGIKGLNGGHSGAEIHKERGNALKLLGRIINQVNKACDITLADIQGGLKINAIPREANCTFTTSADREAIVKVIEKVVQEIRVELEHTDGRLEYELTEVDVKQQFAKDESNDMIGLLVVCPTGLRHKSDLLDGLTVASENIGIVSIVDGVFTCEMSMRGALESYIQDMVDEAETLGTAFGFETSSANWYPAWDYVEHSVVRDLMVEAYREVTGKEMVLEGIHAGLECGIFKNKFPDMDIVAFGPNIVECHSPNEKIELASFDRTYQFLVDLLEKL